MLFPAFHRPVIFNAYTHGNQPIEPGMRVKSSVWGSGKECPQDADSVTGWSSGWECCFRGGIRVKQEGRSPAGYPCCCAREKIC